MKKLTSLLLAVLVMCPVGGALAKNPAAQKFLVDR